MLVVALVSGGKDSCHALGLALQGGHEVACLANLAPPVAVMEAARKREAEGEGGSENASNGTETEDVDSHCFQTVGAVAAGALAAATGLPLVRRHLMACSSSSSSSAAASAAETASSPSVDRSLAYDDAVAGDEVEDLAALLAACRRLFPGIQGVVSGAVASDYQRLRVEHAALRAGGLVSIAPLWRRPQRALLAEMEAASLDALLVKVACVGLGASHVGTRLGDAVPELLRLAKKFGVHPAGEGGEYETMTLDCLAFKRARLEVASVAAASPPSSSSSPPSFSVVDAGAGTFVASGLRLEAVVKNGSEGIPEGEVVWVDGEPPPPRLRGPVVPPPHSPAPSSHSPACSGSPAAFLLSKCGSVRARVVCARSGAGGVQVSAIAEARRRRRATATTGDDEGKGGAAAPFSDEEIADAVAAALDSAGAALRDLARGGGGEGAEEEEGNISGGENVSPPCPFSRATHIRLYLPTMRAFSAANARYGERMPRSSPPARACVACDLGSGGGGWEGEEGDGEEFAPAAVVDVLALPPPRLPLPSAPPLRSALHVQSISPWAPACIGPYAQAVTVGNRLLRLAGQIGLDPWSMELVSSSSSSPAGGADEENGSEQGGPALAPPPSAAARLEAARALRSCQAVAVACRADLRGGGMAACAVFASVEAGPEGLEEAGRALDEFVLGGGEEEEEEQEEEEENDDGESPFEDEYLRRLPPPASRRTASPLRTFFLVAGLPRGAAVEFEPLAWTAAGQEEETRNGGGGGSGLSSWASSSSSASGRCDALVSPGRLCLARAVAERSGGDGRGLEGAFGEALAGIAAALGEASCGGRLPLALVSARAFFRSSPSSGSPEDTIASASAALARAWEKEKGGFSAAAAAAPVAVPVAALGAAPGALGADVAVEVHFERIAAGSSSSSGCSSSSSDSD